MAPFVGYFAFGHDIFGSIGQLPIPRRPHEFF
jgi:hypothetical protein